MKVSSVEPLPTRRRLVLLVGNGVGPKVALRSKSACIRISGLAKGDMLEVSIDNTVHEFESDGSFGVPGGEFAQAGVVGDSNVTCEVLY